MNLGIYFARKDVFNANHGLIQGGGNYFSQGKRWQWLICSLWNPSPHWVFPGIQTFWIQIGSTCICSIHNFSTQLTSLRDSHEGLKTSLKCTFVLTEYYTTSGTRKFAFIFVFQFCDRFIFLQLHNLYFFIFSLIFFTRMKNHRGKNSIFLYKKLLKTSFNEQQMYNNWETR